MLSNHAIWTANHIANLIERNAALYESSPAFRAMVDSTVLFTDEERHQSERIIGGQYKDRQFVGL